MKRTSILASITSAIFAISAVIVGAPSANASISLPKGSLLPCSAGGGAYCIESVSVTPSGAKAIALSWVATGSTGAAAGNTTNVAAGKTLPGRWTADAAFANENYDGLYVDAKAANDFVPWLMLDAAPTFSPGNNVSLAATTASTTTPVNLNSDALISVKLRISDFKVGVTYGIATEATVDFQAGLFEIAGYPVKVPQAKSSKDCSGQTGVASAVVTQFQSIIVPSNDPMNRYGSFSLALRSLTDTDIDPKILERWEGINLDPSSDRYIAKVLGDVNAYYDFDRDDAAQKLVIEGSYTLRSRYVRVEVSDAVSNEAIDPTALPMGFRGIDHLVTSGSAPLAQLGGLDSGSLSIGTELRNLVEPPLPFRNQLNDGTGQQTQVNSRYYWGVKFEHIADLNEQNSSILQDKSMNSFTKHFPSHSTVNINFLVGDNTGAADSVQNGILDADRFCNNLFTLENIKIVTGSNGSVAQNNDWQYASYVRKGNITTDDVAKSRAVTTSDLSNSQNRKFLKFSFIMQGGFDGVNIFDQDEYDINNAAVVADMNDVNRGRSSGPNVSAYLKALEVMKNTTNVDIQLLAIPGIRAPIVTDDAIRATEERFDALYIMDIEQVDKNGNLISITTATKPSVSETVAQHKARNLNTSFAASYFPDVLIKDPSLPSNMVVVPPSVVVMGALALNDSLGYPWFAPAGLTRGDLPSALETSIQLKDADLDSLYDEDVNPIYAPSTVTKGGTNPKGGVVVWGQKTMLQSASALDRINVRRLLIDIRRQVRDIAQTIIFEPNREATLARFTAAVTPRLQRIQALAGLERFRVIIDSSTTTQADVENNTVRGKIFLQPTKTVEFVSLDFVVANNLQQVQ